MKRSFSLVLCLCLLLCSLCGVSARELPYTDTDRIHHPDAVTVLTYLGLFQGGKDGAFCPDDPITRAEAAKLVSLMLGGDTDAAPAPLSDIAGAWYEPYINHCCASGMLSGYPDGTFRGSDPVSAQALAKLLLGVIGYDTSGYVGSDWGIRVDAFARELGIYNGYELSTTAPLSRDYAALLIFNALDCFAVASDDGETVTFVEDDLLNPVSVLQHRFGVVRYQEIVMANAYLDLEHPGTALKAGETKLRGHYAMPFDTDLSALGRTLTVYLRDGQLFGAPIFDPTEFCVTVTGQGAFDDLLSYGGYSVSRSAMVYDNGIRTGTDVLATLGETDSVTLIDYESDGCIDTLLIFRWIEAPVLNREPLVIEIDGESQVFPGTSSHDESVSVITFGGDWIVRAF